MKYLGDFSATPPWHSRHMECEKCQVSWRGCWDNFQCPQCGEGDLPRCSDNTIDEADETMTTPTDNSRD